MNKGDIQNFISNPLIIIGNGPSVLGKEWGSVIDSRFQTVVRINDFVTEGHEEDVGSRTDLWVTGASHRAIIKNRSLYRCRTIAVCSHGVLELIPLKDRVGVEAEKAFLLSVEDMNTIRKESGLKKPSAGMKAIFSFLIIFEVPNIYVLGFDFFLDTGKNHYYEDNSKKIGMGHNWKDEKRVFDKLLKKGKISMIDKINEIEKIENAI